MIFAFSTDDSKGTISFIDSPAFGYQGNIFKGIKKSSSYLPLIQTVKVGGKKVAF